MPAVRQDFWMSKFAATVARDERQTRALRDAGWKVLILWECELKSDAEIEAVLTQAVAALTRD